MPPRAEWSLQRLAARGLLAALLALAAIPAYLTLAPAWRPAAVRLACTAIVIAACIRVIRRVRDARADDAPSAFDAPRPPPPAPEPDARFLRLRDDVVFSTRSRRYFDAILWPRLLRLAGADLPRPEERRGRHRRGPSLSTIESLITEIERRP